MGLPQKYSTFSVPMTLDELRTPMLSLFDSVATELFQAMDPFGPMSKEIKTRAYPKVDVRVVENNLVFEAVVPFIRKEDLKIDIRDGVLQIKGTIQKDKKIEDDHFIKRELVRSSFARSFPLNDGMYDAWNKAGGEVKADLKDGILTITLVNFITESRAKPNIRQIDIN